VKGLSFDSPEESVGLGPDERDLVGVSESIDSKSLLLSGGGGENDDLVEEEEEGGKVEIESA